MVSMVAALAKSGAPAATDPKLQKAAKEFEAMLLSDLMKLGSEDEASEGELDQSCQGYEDMRNQAVATAMANSGGIGIGRMLVERLSAGGRH